MIGKERFTELVGDLKFVEAFGLIENEPEEDIKSLESIEIKGEPLLFYLVGKSQHDGVYSLVITILKSGVSADIIHDGDPLLHNAVRPDARGAEYNQDNVHKVFKVVLDHVKEVDLQTERGMTSLNYAAHSEREEMVYWLCERNANPDIVDDDEMSAFLEVGLKVRMGRVTAAETKIYEFLNAYKNNNNVIPQDLKKGRSL